MQKLLKVLATLNVIRLTQLLLYIFVANLIAKVKILLPLNIYFIKVIIYTVTHKFNCLVINIFFKNYFKIKVNFKIFSIFLKIYDDLLYLSLFILCPNR